MIESGSRLVNPAAKLISVVLHVAIGAAGIYLIQLASTAPRPPSRTRLLFLARSAEAIVPPIERVRLTPPPVARETRQPEPAPPQIETPPLIRRVEPLPPVPAPALPQPAATPPPKPLEVKAVAVGVFARVDAPN